MPVCRSCKKVLNRYKSFWSIPACQGKPERLFCSVGCLAKHLTARFADELGLLA